MMGCHDTGEFNTNQKKEDKMGGKVGEIMVFEKMIRRIEIKVITIKKTEYKLEKEISKEKTTMKTFISSEDL